MTNNNNGLTAARCVLGGISVTHEDGDHIDTIVHARAAYVRDRERQYRRESRGIPTDAQRAQWAAEFDRWAAQRAAPSPGPRVPPKAAPKPPTHTERTDHDHQQDDRRA